MNTELLQVGLSEYGLTEMPGAQDNPRIIEIAKEAGFGEDYKHDSVAWCSMFLNWMAFKANLERSKSLAARSWLTVGEAVDNAKDADVVVLWRDNPSGPFGHVGIPIVQRGNTIWIFGGNQGNVASIASFSTSRILGFRRLRKI